MNSDLAKSITRRQLLKGCGLGLGGIALADLLANDLTRHRAGRPRRARATALRAAGARRNLPVHVGGAVATGFVGLQAAVEPAARRAIARLGARWARLTGMSGNQSSIPLVGSPFKFGQHGAHGAWFSELLPHTASIADDLCIVRSMFTEAINHGPGVTLFQTGTQIAGRPSIGAWLSYGLGQENADLPSFVVLITKDKGGQRSARICGGADSCPRGTRGCCFARPRIRSCTSIIRRA